MAHGGSLLTLLMMLDILDDGLDGWIGGLEGKMENFPSAWVGEPTS